MKEFEMVQKYEKIKDQANEMGLQIILYPTIQRYGIITDNGGGSSSGHKFSRISELRWFIMGYYYGEHGFDYYDSSEQDNN